MSPVAVTSFAFWTPAGVYLRKAPELGAPGQPLAAWPGAPAVAEIHPRARRPHAQAISLVRLAHALLEEREASAPPGTSLPDRAGMGILLGTASGSARVDGEFEEGLASRGAAFGSPSAFVYTLSTSAPAELTLALGLRGPLTTLSMGVLSGTAAVIRAAAHVRAGRFSACFCGGVELSRNAGQSGMREGMGLFLLEHVDEESPWPILESGELAPGPGTPGCRSTFAEDPLGPLAELATALTSSGPGASPATSLAWTSSTGELAQINIRRDGPHSAPGGRPCLPLL